MLIFAFIESLYTLSEETFATRNFREHKLSRMDKTLFSRA